MKTSVRTLALCGNVAAAIALGFSANANVTISNSSLGTATSFPTTSLSGVNGSLFFQDTLTTPANATLQGSTSYQIAAANTGWGEIFNYSGSGADLSAISIIIDKSYTGGGNGTYQPFLFDLGATIYQNTTFNPSAQVNLLGNYTVQPPALASVNFLEFDFSGVDAITLTHGDSYAFGLLNNNGVSDMSYFRGGSQLDTQGDGFTLTSLSATVDNAEPYTGAVRNSFIGVYTEPVPEPASTALFGLSLLVGTFVLRRRNV
jgi:hypothetical protein